MTFVTGDDGAPFYNGDDGGQGLAALPGFPTGTLAEQTLGPPATSRTFPRITAARTEARPPAPLTTNH